MCASSTGCSDVVVHWSLRHLERTPEVFVAHLKEKYPKGASYHEGIVPLGSARPPRRRAAPRGFEMTRHASRTAAQPVGARQRAGRRACAGARSGRGIEGAYRRLLRRAPEARGGRGAPAPTRDPPTAGRLAGGSRTRGNGPRIRDRSDGRLRPGHPRPPARSAGPTAAPAAPVHPVLGRVSSGRRRVRSHPPNTGTPIEAYSALFRARYRAIHRMLRGQTDPPDLRPIHDIHGRRGRVRHRHGPSGAGDLEAPSSDPHGGRRERFARDARSEGFGRRAPLVPTRTRSWASSSSSAASSARSPSPSASNDGRARRSAGRRYRPRSRAGDLPLRPSCRERFVPLPELGAPRRVLERTGTASRARPVDRLRGGRRGPRGRDRRLPPAGEGPRDPRHRRAVQRARPPTRGAARSARDRRRAREPRCGLPGRAPARASVGPHRVSPRQRPCPRQPVDVRARWGRDRGVPRAQLRRPDPGDPRRLGTPVPPR